VIISTTRIPSRGADMIGLLARAAAPARIFMTPV
jgi:hypothetical protein